MSKANNLRLYSFLPFKTSTGRARFRAAAMTAACSFPDILNSLSVFRERFGVTLRMIHIKAQPCSLYQRKSKLFSGSKLFCPVYGPKFAFNFTPANGGPNPARLYPGLNEQANQNQRCYSQIKMWYKASREHSKNNAFFKYLFLI